MCDCYRVIYANDVDDERTLYYRCEEHKAQLSKLEKKNAELRVEMKRIHEEMKKIDDEYRLIFNMRINEKFVEEEDE